MHREAMGTVSLAIPSVPDGVWGDKSGEQQEWSGVHRLQVLDKYQSR